MIIHDNLVKGKSQDYFCFVERERSKNIGYIGNALVVYSERSEYLLCWSPNFS